MSVDWNKKSTWTLLMVLGSLLRYQGNAKTEKEKKKTAENIAAIKKILKDR
jgi:hypothetical protein